LLVETWIEDRRMRAQRGYVSSGVALCLSLALVGCGGGGGGGGNAGGDPGNGGGTPPPQNRAPTANAGVDQAATLNATVTLDGAASADGDGDSFTYRWAQTSGTPVELSSTASSRPTFTAPGQSSRLIFTLITNDGTVDSASDSVTVTVVDESTVQIAALTAPPANLNYGDSANFKVQATDGDGAALPGYELAFGPAGFSVTPQGDVSWSAAGPLFDSETNFNWGVRVTGVPSVLLTGTIRVTDATREYPLRRTELNIPVRNSGLRIADLDGDGTREVLVGSWQAVYVLSRSGATYQQSWVYPFDPGISGNGNSGTGLQAVTSADIDGDGKQEIFFSKVGRLVRLDGATRREAANVELRCRGLEIADLDADGTQELVCLNTESDYQYETDGRIMAVNPSTLVELWSTPEISVGANIAIGNVDGDPALEIVTASGLVYDGDTHLSQWAHSQPFGYVVDTGDMDGDGVEEIVGVADFSGVSAYSAVLESPLWQYTPSTWDLDTVVVADANGDGRVEAIVGDAQWGNVSGIGYNSTSQQPELLWQINSQDHGVSSIAVGDVDADGANEVVWGSGASSSGRDDFVIAGFTPAISVKWQSSSMPTMRDITYSGGLARIGGGATRLMFSAATDVDGFTTDPRYAPGTRAIALTPMSGGMEFSDRIGSDWSGLSAAFTVADYDNDDIDELFIGDPDGFFAAYDFAAGSFEWQSQRSLTEKPVAAKLADMNGDGYADLVGLTTGGYIEVHDVHSQSLLWRGKQTRDGVAVALSDLDNDGKPEIIVATQDRIVIYGKDLTATTYSERASVEYADAVDVVVADLDGNSVKKIYALSAPLWTGDATLSVFDTSLRPVRSTALGVRASALYVEQSAFARKNLLLAVTQGDFHSESAELWAIDPATGTDVWRSPLLVSPIPRDSVHFVDVDGDGDDEIAFSTYFSMYHTR
jgi:hypothetical protein